MLKLSRVKAEKVENLYSDKIFMLNDEADFILVNYKRLFTD